MSTLGPVQQTPAAQRAALIAEIGKLGAFFRRDFLTAWSYRIGFLTALIGLLAQAFVFSFVSRMVDRNTLPTYGGTLPSYMAFVAIGIAVNSLLNVGIGRTMAAMRGEQLMGTLESLLVTPTSATTLQLGLVVYDLVEVPIKTAVFLGFSILLFDVRVVAAGVVPAVAALITFLPFVWGLGAASAAAVLVFRQATSLIGLAGYALGIASGAFFPLDLLPPWAASTARFNPVAITLTATREALLGGAGWNEVLPRIVWLVPISLGTLALGMLAFRLAARWERRAGTLGQY